MSYWNLVPTYSYANIPNLYKETLEEYFQTTVFGTRADDNITFRPDIDKVYGFDGDDYIVGRPEVSGAIIRESEGAVIYGGNGDDWIIATKGDDRIFGGADNDRIEGTEGADSIDGDEGVDVVTYGDSEEGIFVSLDTGTGRGGMAEGDTFRNVESVFGSRYNYIIYGDSGANSLFGEFGSDLLLGLAGDDVIDGGINVGSDPGDVLHGGGGLDTFLFERGGSGHDIYYRPVSIDVIKDWNLFGAVGDVMQFDVTDPAKARWIARDTEFNGMTGAMVEVEGNGRRDGYDVFLEGVAAADLDGSDFIFV